MVFGMVVLGGATRLTGSGLSIMEWAPLRGALPPMSEGEWERLFRLYQAIPQYELVNKGFGLEGFKQIFWLEWVHRFWGRLIGLVFLLPLLWFWWRGAIPRQLTGRMLLLFALGGLQGAIGWFMVASGFAPDSTAVSPYRLVVHLSLALLLYGVLLWTALDQWRQAAARPLPPAGAGGKDQPSMPAIPGRVRRLTLACCGAVALTILAGSFVAGLHAGSTYNTYPLMDGAIVPPGYGLLRPWPLNLTENVAAVQFNHRLLATATLLLVAATVWTGLARLDRGPARSALAALGATVLLQYLLGVTTLLLIVPVGLGTLHQACAVAVLTAALVAVHLQRRPAGAVGGFIARGAADPAAPRRGAMVSCDSADAVASPARLA